MLATELTKQNFRLSISLERQLGRIHFDSSLFLVVGILLGVVVNLDLCVLRTKQLLRSHQGMLGGQGGVLDVAHEEILFPQGGKQP